MFIGNYTVSYRINKKKVSHEFAVKGLNFMATKEHYGHEYNVKTGKIDYMMSQVGEGKACWDCHRDVPHGGSNSLSSTPNALVPYPESPVPDWLQKMLKK